MSPRNYMKPYARRFTFLWSRILWKNCTLWKHWSVDPCHPLRIAWQGVLVKRALFDALMVTLAKQPFIHAWTATWLWWPDPYREWILIMIPTIYSSIGSYWVTLSLVAGSESIGRISCQTKRVSRSPDWCKRYVFCDMNSVSREQQPPCSHRNRQQLIRLKCYSQHKYQFPRYFPIAW